MSIVRMRKVFRKKLKIKAGRRHVTLASPAEIIFYVIIVIFVVGAYYMFGGANGGSGTRRSGTAGGNVTSVVATVNGERISRGLYDANLQRGVQQMSSMGDIDFTQKRYLETGTLNNLINALLMRQGTKQENIRVSGADIAQAKAKDVDQIVQTRFPDRKLLRTYLIKQNITYEQYKQKVAQESFPNDDAIRETVAEQKLQDQIQGSVKLTDQQLRDTYTEVQASYILISPQQEAAKAAKGQKPGTPAPNGDALAQKKANDILQQLKKGANFATLAKQYSDDPTTATAGGDLGWSKQDAMFGPFADTAFADAAFALKPGQLSGVVKTSSGYDIIKVTGRRTQLPKDFNKNIATYRAQAEQQAKAKKWRDYQQQLKTKAKIVIKDPALRAYRLLDQGNKVEGLKTLAEAVKQDPSDLTAQWELATLYDQSGDPVHAGEVLQKIVLTEDGANAPEAHLKLGDVYEQQAKTAQPAEKAVLTKKALSEYQNASDRAASYTMTNMAVNQQLAQKFKTLGDKTLEAQTEKWLADYAKQQGNSPYGAPMGNFQVH